MKKMLAVILIFSLLIVQESWSKNPDGTYMETCSDIEFDGETLTASCEKEDKREKDDKK